MAPVTTVPSPPADKSLLEEGSAVLGIIQQFAMGFLAFQGSSCETLSKSIFQGKMEASTSHSAHQINFLIDFDSTHS